MFFLGHCSNVVEVEAQTAGGAQRSGLANVGPQHGSQRGMEQVGAAVIARRVETALDFHLGGHGFAQGNVAVGNQSPMDDEAGHRALGVFDTHATVGSGYRALIAHLSAAFGVKAGLSQDDLDLLAPGGVSHRLPFAQDAEDARVSIFVR